MKKNISILFLLVLTVSLTAQNALDTFINSDLLRNANVSLMVKDLVSGKTLYEYRPNNATIPASTLKTITTSTALELLGGDYSFKTTLEYDGELNIHGVLHGNLYIYGSGDPTLGSVFLGDTLFLNHWSEEVKRAGIQKIHGDIIADNSRYDVHGINQHWQWEDLGSYYGSGAYAISYKDNTYSIQFKSGEIGTTPEITKITPEIKELNIINHLKTTKIKSDSIYIIGPPRNNERMLYGEMPANKERISADGDIPCPGLLLAEDFKQALCKNNIRVSGEATETFSKSNVPRKVIYTHFSPELRDIVKAINVPSNNHFAEHLFRHLSLLKDSVASSSSAVSVIKDYWEQKSLPTDQLFMVDGSGLSPVNAVSAIFFVNLLTYMDSSKNNIDFRNSLPVAGVSGTAKLLLPKTRLEGKVRAKSGTISRVRCYTGYIDTDDKKWAFAILINNQNGTSREVTNKVGEFLLNITQ